jgi:hypothetical protein
MLGLEVLVDVARIGPGARNCLREAYGLALAPRRVLAKDAHDPVAGVLGQSGRQPFRVATRQGHRLPGPNKIDADGWARGGSGGRRRWCNSSRIGPQKTSRALTLCRRRMRAGGRRIVARGPIPTDGLPCCDWVLAAT